MFVTIGERIRELRTAKGQTGGQVATYLGITSVHVSNIESGKRKPSLDLLAKLAHYFGCSTDYLLGLTDDPSPAGEASDMQRLYNRLSLERKKDLVEMADLWLREESPAYQEELLVRWIETIDTADEHVRELLDEALARLADEGSE